MSQLFRVTDERGWQHLFEAGTASELVRGIAIGWDAYIREHRPPAAAATHPALALPARLAEIRAWLEPRLARDGATAEQIASWTSQAATWRHEAEQSLGGSKSKRLRLHAYAPASGTWVTILPATATAPAVARKVDAARAIELFGHAERMVAHVQNLFGLGDQIEEAIRVDQHPVLRLVGPEGGV